MKAGLLICCHAEGYGLYDDDQYVQYDQCPHQYAVPSAVIINAPSDFKEWL